MFSSTKFLAFSICFVMLVPELSIAVTPQADAPQADAPQADAPQADTPQADTPQADAAQADASPTDEEITAAIAADFQDAERMSGAELKVHVDSGIATLSGSATSLLDKRLASRIAKRTRGIHAVQNQILVTPSQRTDDQIRDDVLKVLRINSSVPQPKLEVSVERGTVAILGKVGSLAEKRIAEFAASGARGVTGIRNQMTVGLENNRTDNELRDEISALIVQSIYFDDAEIKVDVVDRIAKLSGIVGSAAAKDRLEQLAEIWGVTKVDLSDVRIDPESLDGMKRKKRYANVSNASIETAMERSLRADPTAFSFAGQITATADSGALTLSGVVNNLRVKDRATQLAHDIVGVRRVVNELKVEPDEKPPEDIEIIQLTQGALARSAYLDRREIRVHCQDAHVSLYGIVDNALEKSVAQWIASGVPGVVHVNNALAVEPNSKPRTDEEIEAKLRRKLKFEFYDKSNRVDFTVEDGVVILRGEVDTWRQWQAAMDLAIESGGRHPHNMINVRYHPPHGGSRIFVPR